MEHLNLELLHVSIALLVLPERDPNQTDFKFWELKAPCFEEQILQKHSKRLELKTFLTRANSCLLRRGCQIG